MRWHGLAWFRPMESREQGEVRGSIERGAECEAHDVEGVGKRPIDHSRAKDCDICRERGNAEEEMHERRVCPVTLPICASDKLIRHGYRFRSVLEQAGLWVHGHRPLTMHLCPSHMQ